MVCWFSLILNRRLSNESFTRIRHSVSHIDNQYKYLQTFLSVQGTVHSFHKKGCGKTRAVLFLELSLVSCYNKEYTERAM